MTLDDRTNDSPGNGTSTDELAPMRPNRRRRSAVHLGATFMRLLVVLGALLIAASLWTALTGRAVFAGGGASPYLTLDLLPQLKQATPRGEDVIRLVDLPLWVRLMAYAPGVITGIVMVSAAVTTTRVLIAIAAARPFEAATARRVRTLGLLLAIGGTLAGASDTLASVVFTTTQVGDVDQGWHTVYSGLSFTAGDWPWAVIITGVVVTAAAAAFTEGARLQREVDDVI